jgi:hypothetical protein
VLAVRRIELHVIQPIPSREAQGFAPCASVFGPILTVPHSEQLIPSAKRIARSLGETQSFKLLSINDLKISAESWHGLCNRGQR